MNATYFATTTPPPAGQAPGVGRPDDEQVSPDLQRSSGLPAHDQLGSTPFQQARVAAAVGRSDADEDDAERRLVNWIGRIVDHDERALAAFYEATVARVHGIVLRIVRRPSLADEVVEDTFFQVWRQAARFDAARGCALAWLLSMARSRAIDTLRQEARFPHTSLDAASVPEVEDDKPACDDLLDAARGQADLHRALMLLDAQPRQLLAMAFFSGRSHEEIASQTCLPLGTVKSQIRRALGILQRALSDGNRHSPGPAARPTCAALPSS